MLVNENLLYSHGPSLAHQQHHHALTLQSPFFPVSPEMVWMVQIGCCQLGVH
jgi:hypothetical protein